MLDFGQVDVSFLVTQNQETVRKHSSQISLTHSRSQERRRGVYARVGRREGAYLYEHELKPEAPIPHPLQDSPRWQACVDRLMLKLAPHLTHPLSRLEGSAHTRSQR